MTVKPNPVYEYHVFVSCPNDMDRERQAVREFFGEFNRHTASPRGVRFEVVDYENYASIGVGSPQELINRQTLCKYCSSLVLVVGMLGQRFGTPTDKAESGTEEEFNLALGWHSKTGFPEIKWFFRRVDQFVSSPTHAAIKEATAQWKKVLAFRKRLENGSPPVFYKEFAENDFRKVLRKDLSLWLSAKERPWSQHPEDKETYSIGIGGITVWIAHDPGVVSEATYKKVVGKIEDVARAEGAAELEHTESRRYDRVEERPS